MNKYEDIIENLIYIKDHYELRFKDKKWVDQACCALAKCGEINNETAKWLGLSKGVWYNIKNLDKKEIEAIKCSSCGNISNFAETNCPCCNKKMENA